MQAIDGTVLIKLATIFVTFERIGLATVIGGIGVYVLLRCG